MDDRADQKLWNLNQIRNRVDEIEEIKTRLRRLDYKITKNFILLGLLIFLLIISLTACDVVGAHIQNDSNESDIINAIVGEAANQDDYTMLCLAQAIINRGTLKGVYGLNAAHNQNESAKTYARAAQAWHDASDDRYPDHVYGAQNFGTESDLKKLKINFKRIKAQCGDFYFY